MNLGLIPYIVIDITSLRSSLYDKMGVDLLVMVGIGDIDPVLL